MSDALAPVFSYSALDQKLAAKLYAHVVAIKKSMEDGFDAILDAGQRLAEVRDLLPHGSWLSWLETELSWSPWTARRYISVYERFGGNGARVHGLSAQALYALAAPSTPEEAIEEVAALQAAGEPVTTAAVKEVVRKRKTTATARVQAGAAEVTPAAPADLAVDLPRLHEKLKSVAELAATLDDMRKLAGSLSRVYARDPELQLAAAGLVGLKEMLDDVAVYVARQLWPEGACPECHGMRATISGECQACRGGGWAPAQALHGNGRK